MHLRKVDSGVYVTGDGQFVISLSRSGRRAFLVPDVEVERYVMRRSRVKAIALVLLAATAAAAWMTWISPFWIAAAPVCGLGLFWLAGRDVSERFPLVNDPEIVSEIASRHQGSEPEWFPWLSLAVLGLSEWSSRHPAKSGAVAVIVSVLLALGVAFEFAITRRARDAHESDHSSSRVTPL